MGSKVSQKFQTASQELILKQLPVGYGMPFIEVIESGRSSAGGHFLLQSQHHQPPPPLVWRKHRAFVHQRQGVKSVLSCPLILITLIFIASLGDLLLLFNNENKIKFDNGQLDGYELLNTNSLLYNVRFLANCCIYLAPIHTLFII